MSLRRFEHVNMPRFFVTGEMCPMYSWTGLSFDDLGGNSSVADSIMKNACTF